MCAGKPDFRRKWQLGMPLGSRTVGQEHHHPDAGGTDLSHRKRHPQLEEYISEPEPQLNGRRIGQARGRCLGGSSAINGMVFVRGNPRDYDNWTRFGLEDWKFEDCLPYFKRLECFAGGTDPNRGTGGPLSVQESKADHVFHDRFLEAAAQFGLKRTPDHDSTVHKGSHVTQATIRGGIRSSTAEAYLDPVKSRANLAIRTNCFVNRLLFEGKAAVGVEYSTRGSPQVIRAAKEVVLCAGTIGSPQILMLSGIGDAEHLTEHDIDVVQNVPGVGGNVQDHVVAPLRYRYDKPTSVKRHLDLFGRIRLGAEWLLFRKGFGASNFFEVGAFFNSGDAPGGYPDLQHEFLPFLADFQDGKVALADGFQYFVSKMRPFSRGCIRLKSPDPRKHPAIYFNHLDDSRDLVEMLNGIRMTREMAHQPAWDEFRHAELDQDLKDFSDEELTCWLRVHANTEHHPVGTCRMGDDDNAVTDSSGRVHGVDRLRVVDGSILPLVPTANINGPIVMVAEKISDSILGKRPLPRQQLKWSGKLLRDEKKSTTAVRESASWRCPRERRKTRVFLSEGRICQAVFKTRESPARKWK